jgi:hypothetical protein
MRAMSCLGADRECGQSLTEQDWSTAEDRAEEARMARVSTSTQGASRTKQIDEKRAEQIAARKKLVDEGKCERAQARGRAGAAKSREHFKLEVKRRAGRRWSVRIEEGRARRQEGNVEAARSLLSSPDATTALSGEGFKLVEQALLKAIVAAAHRIQPPSPRKMDEALAKLDELVQGQAQRGRAPIALELVQTRSAILLAFAKRPFRQNRAKRSRGSTRKSRLPWKMVPKGSDRCQKLAVASRMRSSAASWPSPRRAGRGGDRCAPPRLCCQADRQACTRRSGNHAAEARPGRDEDPGAASGADDGTAAGWVDTTNLQTSDTDMWLPPPEQLAGVQVWGPLRPPAKEYSLGVVSKVDGKKVTVKRLADGREETIALADIRAGKLEKGLKVMAFCTNQLRPEPAKVDSIVTSEGGSPKVKVICEKGDLQKVELGGSLTTKAEWLPPRKP